MTFRYGKGLLALLPASELQDYTFSLACDRNKYIHSYPPYLDDVFCILRLKTPNAAATVEQLTWFLRG
jgi:hypothetical protein